MRFMILMKSDKKTEAGVMPDDAEKLLTEMGKFNEELVKAGVMLAGEGLHPSSKGARVRFSGTKRNVVDGPFAETKEALGGYYVVDVVDLDRALELAADIPGAKRELSRIEVRPIMELPG